MICTADVELVVTVAEEHRIEVHGDVDLMGSPHLGLALDDAVDSSRDVVVDLSEAEFLSCRAAGLLVGCHDALRASGRRMTVCGAHPALYRSLAICGLDAALAS
ncbi:STAS domain-containing protein [Pseudonocardia sp.]|uniref:STAS domain-containing protein n=1 Tax=Pseudonocardia sp. TaxID=60912 RepID=UPI00261C8296|nr:STAS domain-containing protein [Pseudonocardia sp.]